MRNAIHVRRWLSPLGVALALAGCAADQARREGQALIDEGRYEEGLAKFGAIFERTTGRPFDPETDALDWEEVNALPSYPSDLN